MRSIAVADMAVASTGELVEAAHAVLGELAGRAAPESAAVCMELTARLGGALDLGEAALASLVGRVDGSGELRGWGHSSTTSWLKQTLGTGGGTAKRRVVVERQLQRLPTAAKLLASGELSFGYAATIAEAVTRLTDADAAAAEQICLGWVRDGWSVAQVTKAAARIRDIIAERDGTDTPDEDGRRGYRRSWLTLSGGLEGGGYLKGWLNPADLALWRERLGPLAKPAGAHDDRDHAQRMADAMRLLLGEGGRHWNATLIIDLAKLSSTDDGPGSGTVDPDPAGSTGSGPDATSSDPDGTGSGPAGTGLAGLLDGDLSARLLDGTPISADEARQIAVNAGVNALILGPGSLPLYYGRTRRFVTEPQRRVLQALYDSCTVDHCDIPAYLCQIDHVNGWDNGAATDIDQLTPLCGFHNRYKHDHPDRITTTRRPDGRWRYIIGPPDP